MNYHHTKHTKLTGSTGLKFKLNVQQGFPSDSVKNLPTMGETQI